MGSLDKEKGEGGGDGGVFLTRGRIAILLFVLMEAVVGCGGRETNSVVCERLRANVERRCFRASANPKFDSLCEQTAHDMGLVCLDARETNRWNSLTEEQRRIERGSWKRRGPTQLPADAE
ncbi:hypothetical protein HOF67_01540 [Candidatus Peregrinibacteria bacterium]|jgi:hypothetical protein|nr:hypothetical protein [Candidatus Peregrinibacteria bacterium]